MDPLMNPAAWPPAYPPPPPFFPQPQISAANNNNHPVPQSEPPYHDMIIAAITALKEREGSSRQAIDRYIQNVYTGNLPSNHATLLTCHLKKMKTDGALAMVKHSYALPGSGSVLFPPPPSSDFLSPSPKPRGRPPKPKTPSDPAAAVVVPSPDPNQPNAETMLVSLGLVDGPKKGRGRPKKTRTDGGPETTPKAVTEKKPRGRPPRPVRDVGRAPRLADQQAAATGGGRPRGRPSGGGRPRKVAVPGGSKPRGRPRKFPVAGGGILALVGVKRGRGRPPKAGGGGVTKKLRMYSGKPLGRPRKNALTPATQVAAQNLVAYQDLTNKLVHFQSRVKHAVDLVRPYFTSEATPYVYGALQELEVLANTDMTAPPQAEPQQPPAVVPQGFENP